METAQRLDQQKIHREPYRPAPVGVAAEKPCGRFRRLIVNLMVYSGNIQHVRMLFVIARERANAMRRQKLFFIEHDGKNALEVVRGL